MCTKGDKNLKGKVKKGVGIVKVVNVTPLDRITFLLKILLQLVTLPLHDIVNSIALVYYLSF